MVEPKRANWADESDSEWSEEEAETKQEPEESTVQSVTQSTPQPSHLETRLAQLTPPYRLRLNNLSYNITSDKEIKKFLMLKLDEEERINLQLVVNAGNFRGIATLETSELEIALKVAKRNGAPLKERPVAINIDGEYSGPPQSRRGGGGNRRGGDRPRDDRPREDRPREDRPRKPRDDRAPRDDRPPREDRRPRDDRAPRGTHPRKGGFRGQPYQKLENVNPEYVRKGSDSGFVRSPAQNVIAESGVVASNVQSAIDSKPKSSPFGAARPVDTQSRDIEFEKKKTDHDEVPEGVHPVQPVHLIHPIQEVQVVQPVHEVPSAHQPSHEVQDIPVVPERKYSEPKRYKKVAQSEPVVPREEPVSVPTPPPERKVIIKAWRNPEEAKSILVSSPPSVSAPEVVIAQSVFQSTQNSSTSNARGQNKRSSRRGNRGRRGRG